MMLMQPCQQVSVRNKLQFEFSQAVLKTVHDIASPLAALEMLSQSTSVSLSAGNKIILRQIAMNMRETMNKLHKATIES